MDPVTQATTTYSAGTAAASEDTDTSVRSSLPLPPAMHGMAVPPMMPPGLDPAVAQRMWQQAQHMAQLAWQQQQQQQQQHQQAGTQDMHLGATQASNVPNSAALPAAATVPLMPMPLMMQQAATAAAAAFHGANARGAVPQPQWSTQATAAPHAAIVPAPALLTHGQTTPQAQTALADAVDGVSDPSPQDEGAASGDGVDDEEFADFMGASSSDLAHKVASGAADNDMVRPLISAGENIASSDAETLSAFQDSDGTHEQATTTEDSVEATLRVDSDAVRRKERSREIPKAFDALIDEILPQNQEDARLPSLGDEVQFAKPAQTEPAQLREVDNKQTNNKCASRESVANTDNDESEADDFGDFSSAAANVASAKVATQSYLPSEALHPDQTDSTAALGDSSGVEEIAGDDFGAFASAAATASFQPQQESQTVHEHARAADDFDFGDFEKATASAPGVHAVGGNQRQQDDVLRLHGAVTQDCGVDGSAQVSTNVSKERGNDHGDSNDDEDDFADFESAAAVPKSVDVVEDPLAIVAQSHVLEEPDQALPGATNKIVNDSSDGDEFADFESAAASVRASVDAATAVVTAARAAQTAASTLHATFGSDAHEDCVNDHAITRDVVVVDAPDDDDFADFESATSPPVIIASPGDSVQCIGDETSAHDDDSDDLGVVADISGSCLLPVDGKIDKKGMNGTPSKPKSAGDLLGEFANPEKVSKKQNPFPQAEIKMGAADGAGKPSFDSVFFNDRNGGDGAGAAIQSSSSRRASVFDDLVPEGDAPVNLPELPALACVAEHDSTTQGAPSVESDAKENDDGVCCADQMKRVIVPDPESYDGDIPKIPKHALLMLIEQERLVEAVVMSDYIATLVQVSRLKEQYKTAAGLARSDKQALARAHQLRAQIKKVAAVIVKPDTTLYDPLAARSKAGPLIMLTYSQCTRLLKSVDLQKEGTFLFQFPKTKCFTDIARSKRGVYEAQYVQHRANLLVRKLVGLLPDECMHFVSAWTRILSFIRHSLSEFAKCMEEIVNVLTSHAGGSKACEHKTFMRLSKLLEGMSEAFITSVRIDIACRWYGMAGATNVAIKESGMESLHRDICDLWDKIYQCVHHSALSNALAPFSDALEAVGCEAAIIVRGESDVQNLRDVACASTPFASLRKNNDLCEVCSLCLCLTRPAGDTARGNRGWRENDGPLLREGVVYHASCANLLQIMPT